MVDDYGLIGGIGQGIQQGLLMYQKQKQLNRENQIQNLTSGLQTDADGNLQLNDQAQLHKNAQAVQDQAAMDKQNVGSDRSKSAVGLLKAQANSINPGSGDQIPDMSEDQVKELGVPLQKPGVTNYYAMQKQQANNDAKGQLAQTNNEFKGQENTKNRTNALNVADKRGSFQGARLDYQQQKEARATGDKDSILKMYSQRLEGAAKINELIQSAQSGKVVSNSALLGQLNAEVGRLETGSQNPGLGQGEKTELLDKKAHLQSIIDSWTGNPTDAVDPKVLQTTAKMVNELSGSYKRGIDSRTAYLKAGMNPKQQGIIDQKQKAMQDTYAPRLGGWGESQGLVGNGQQPAAQDYPVGTTAKSKTGVPVVYKGNGQWVPQ